MTVIVNVKLKTPEIIELELEVKALKHALYMKDSDVSDRDDLIEDLQKQIVDLTDESI